MDSYQFQGYFYLFFNVKNQLDSAKDQIDGLLLFF